LASSLRGKFQFGLFLGLIIGTSLVIACGCVINNYIDRSLDKNMARTKHRSLVTGKIPSVNAIVYGIILGLIGFWLLLAYTNDLTALIGAIGLFFYLVMYSFWKRRSWLGTAVGSVSGATPITAGYTAVTGHFDSAALLLFLTMVFWQMPHFYAIAMYRFKDYKSAGLPVLPVKKGYKRTKIEILLYVTAFTITAVMLTVRHYTGYIYMAVMLIVGLYWLQEGIAGFHASDDAKWARRMFFFSLITLLILCVSLSVGALLP
jgi:protoheme IX farnesyltransferase